MQRADGRLLSGRPDRYRQLRGRQREIFITLKHFCFSYHWREKSFNDNETVVSDKSKLSASLNHEAVVVFLVTPS